MLRDPREIVHSLGDLFWRSSQWLWWMVTVFAAGAALFVEHIWPRVAISDQLWLDVVIIGALSSTFVAYHRLRVEHDSLGGEAVPPLHRGQLQQRLEILLENVKAGETCDYGEEPDVRTRNHASFKAHYHELEKSLGDWDAVVDLIGLRGQQLLAAATDKAREEELDESIYEMENLIDVLNRGLREIAEKDWLEKGFELPWSYRSPYPDDSDLDGGIALGDKTVAHIPNLPRETRDERMRPLQLPVEQLFTTLVDSDAARALCAAKKDLVEQQKSLILDLEDWLTVESLRAKRDCDICRKNLGLAGAAG